MHEIETLAAGMLCVGFAEKTVPDSLVELLGRGVRSVVLFARNVESPAQVRALTDEIRAKAPGPVMICVDQEGGRVRRLRDGFTPIASMRELGQTNDETLAFEVGRILGVECRAVGFDVDFAPVLDVDTNPKNPVIADRSLGSDANRVATLGAKLIAGLQSANVAACGKHFPGHGDTSQDSHHDLPRLDHDLSRLRSVELVPFAAAVKAGVASMMTSHIIFSPLDSKRPATLSPLVLDAILRREMNFDGVVFTDDMEMKAIANHFGVEASCVEAVNAGADVVTICHSLDRQHAAIETLAKAIESGAISRERAKQSTRRIDTLIERFVKAPRPGVDAIAGESNLQIAAKVGTAGVALDPTNYRPGE